MNQAKNPSVRSGFFSYETKLIELLKKVEKPTDTELGDLLRSVAANRQFDWDEAAKEILGKLSDKSAAVNKQDAKTGNTALHLAAWRGHPETVKVLLENGADPRITNTRGQGNRAYQMVPGDAKGQDLAAYIKKVCRDEYPNTVNGSPCP